MKTTGRVNGIISNIVIVKADGPVGQNEICYVWTGRPNSSRDAASSTAMCPATLRARPRARCTVWYR
mgnify:CR=1 FL=1